jgi:hypothetical protein
MPVNIVEVPKGADGADQGIDDYLAGGGLLDDLKVRAFEEGWMPPEDWPELPEEALHGAAGKVVAHIRPNTEADLAAILALFLASFGNACGRGAHFVVEDTRHYPKLFTVIVGESSKSRKGTAQGRINKLIGRLDEEWAAKCFKQGLSSGEGLIHHVRDKKTKTDKDGKIVVVDEGVSEKRLLVEEEEFASVLIMMAREGSILSTVLRAAWDDKRLATMTKNSSETASDTHITMVAHITKDELLRHMTSNKLGGGIANRHSFFLVRRSKLLPRGGGQEEWPDELIEELRTAVEFGKVDRCINLSEEPEVEYGGRSAGELWDEVYPDLSEAAPGLFGVVTSRAEAQVRRIATLYAVLDRSRKVKVAHLMAALALWEFSRQSSYLLFGQKTGDVLADEIMDALDDAGEEGMTQSEINRYFGSNYRAGRLRAALNSLEKAGWVRSEKAAKEGPGRPEIRWWSIREG